MTAGIELPVAAAGAFAAIGLLSLTSRARPVWGGAVVPFVALSAAAIAWFAPPEATGIGWLDSLLRCGAAAAVSLSAVRAPTVALVSAGALVALGGIGGAWAGPAGAVAGAAVGSAASGLDTPLLRSAVGGAVGVVALHLTWPRSSLATAALAAGAMGLLVVAGLWRMRLPGRRMALTAVGIVVGGAGLATGLGLTAAVLARDDMEAGMTAAQRGLAAARRGDAVVAAEALDVAQASFTAARDRLGAWWARPAFGVPVVARHSRALRTLAIQGAEIADVAARAAVASDPSRLRFERGRVPIEELDSLRQSADELHRVLTSARGRLRDVRSPWLVPLVRHELDRLLGRVERAHGEAHTVSLVTRIAPTMLGRDGPRHYFLALQTPAELRGSGGFIGSFAEISADRGTVRLDRIGRAADLNLGGTQGSRTLDAPQDYLDRYGRFQPDRLWQNVNMSPDFPTVARVIAGLYPQSGGRPVDGVLAVDVHGLAALLRVVGPVEVADWPEPITADNAVRVLLYEQYVRFQGTERVDFLASVTEAVWTRLVGGSAGVVELGRALAAAVGEKHLLLAAVDADEQAALARLGAAGAMAPVDGDFLAVVTQNAGGNKIDWFLRRAVEYRVRLDPDRGRLTATVRGNLTNTAPAGGLPDYVIGNALQPPLPKGTNRTYVSVYTPWLLTSATVDGQAAVLESERERDRHVYSAYVDVPPGGSVVVELQLDGELAVSERTYDLTVHRQPAAAADDFRVGVTVGRQTSEKQVELLRDHRFRVRLE